MNELEQTLFDILVGRCLIEIKRHYPAGTSKSATRKTIKDPMWLTSEEIDDAINDAYDKVSNKVSNDKVLAINLGSELDEVQAEVYLMEDNVKGEVYRRL